MERDGKPVFPATQFNVRFVNLIFQRDFTIPGGVVFVLLSEISDPRIFLSDVKGKDL
jgi:hypothetical protein